MTEAWASRSGDSKEPHWTGSANSGRTFGHFGRSGSFLWVDPAAGIACASFPDRDFGNWAKQAWPRPSDDVLRRFKAERPWSQPQPDSCQLTAHAAFRTVNGHQPRVPALVANDDTGILAREADQARYHFEAAELHEARLSRRVRK